MRRILATLALVALCTAVVVAAAAGSNDDGGSYEVRAVFDNGGFIVSGEDVKVAGAKVGSVVSVDVSDKDEIVSLKGGPHAIPGKAVVVLGIDDPGFKDFRDDASCLIRPQSLIGEKYVDCTPTQARAPGSKPPPALTTVPDGQPGAGQHLLPLENNGKAVDLDLVQNIMRQPFAERFRLIINDLGAGLAARGKDLAVIVRRSNPALRETDQVLAILARQNRQLAKLASDSDTILAPLARERGHVAGFIDSAGATATASAERAPDIERGLQKLPRFLAELRLTMRDLGGLSRQATPVVSDFGRAAPALTSASRQLAPFATSTNIALRSLGNAAEVAGPLLKQADPTIIEVRDLAKSGARPFTDLARLLKSLRQSKGFERLMDFIYTSAGSINGFDQFGHFLRTNFLATNCIDYATVFASECSSKFVHKTSSASSAGTPTLEQLSRLLGLNRKADRKTGGASVPLNLGKADQGAKTGAVGAGGNQPTDKDKTAGARDVLKYLLGQ
jgi:phospholipid/cholesterol/gamma-HCH transport system substrate-binding protein